MRPVLRIFALLLAACGFALFGAAKFAGGAYSEHSRRPPAEITFNRNIAPILYRSCAMCHRAGEAGPFPLLAYTDAKAHARQIAAVTRSRFMPPWLPEPGELKFADEMRLSEEHIAQIQKWVEQGAPEGDARDLPPKPKFTEGWQLGKPDVVVKATGEQWQWVYEYPQDKVTFKSYPIGDEDLKPGQLRNLSVDNEMVVPVNKVVQVLVTGKDVIHQWVVPAFGSRADAIPGRVNRTWFKVTEPGTYYGQCSALCGQGHAYMPIAVKVVSEDEYRKWLAAKQQTAATDSARLALAETGGAEKR